MQLHKPSPTLTWRPIEPVLGWIAGLKPNDRDSRRAAGRPQQARISGPGWHSAAVDLGVGVEGGGLMAHDVEAPESNVTVSSRIHHHQFGVNAGDSTSSSSSNNNVSNRHHQQQV
ncbi:uncharacterized protein A4U43_C08F6810 [Asparagus officinalis]|nr:uncharacterized protein A4U43_C08F6810 [Asparagus officinalis]